MACEISLSQVQSASEAFSEVSYVLYTRKKVVFHVFSVDSNSIHFGHT